MPHKPEPSPITETIVKPPSEVDTRSYLKRNLLWLVIGVVVIVVLAYLSQRLLGHRLEAASRFLTQTLGYPGVFLTIWLIDTFTLPMPPDLVLAFVAHDGSSLDITTALAVICLASVIAGNSGYWIARRLGQTEWLRRRLSNSFSKGHALFEKWGVWSVVVAGLTPVPFSIVCWFAGLYRMPTVPFALATLSRIPRFIGWYYLLRLGFSL